MFSYDKAENTKRMSSRRWHWACCQRCGHIFLALNGVVCEKSACKSWLYRQRKKARRG